MALSMMSKPCAGVRAAPARRSRATLSVRAEAVPENVKEAREWIGDWKESKAASANRASWFPGTELPAHLDGSMVGDFGFDPLNLGVDARKRSWYQQAELLNGRTAMMAVAGVLYKDLLGGLGVGGPAAEVEWFNAGAYTYFAPASALFGASLFPAAWAEIRRWQDIRMPGSVNQDPVFPNNVLSNPSTGYPGFDPLGYSKGADFETLKLKEIKNARLAMVAWAGFLAQAYCTGKGPLANLGDHLASPWTTTVWQNDLARLH